MRSFQSTDGVLWGVQVQVPSHSSAMVVFRHPAGVSARFDRYAWYNAHSPEALDPRARLKTSEVLSTLTDIEIARLFRRSMPIQTSWPGYMAS